jgi:hypothetical protein
MAAGTTLARGTHGAAQPTWLGHCIGQGAIAPAELNLAAEFGLQLRHSGA